MSRVHQQDPAVILRLEGKIRDTARLIADDDEVRIASIVSQKRGYLKEDIIAQMYFDINKSVIVLQGPSGQDGPCELGDDLILAATEVCLDGELQQVRTGNPYRVDRYFEC